MDHVNQGRRALNSRMKTPQSRGSQRSIGRGQAEAAKQRFNEDLSQHQKRPQTSGMRRSFRGPDEASKASDLLSQASRAKYSVGLPDAQS